ncbi:hypothetical protein, partial [Frankia torreyi]
MRSFVGFVGDLGSAGSADVPSVFPRGESSGRPCLADRDMHPVDHGRATEPVCLGFPVTDRAGCRAFKLRCESEDSVE